MDGEAAGALIPRLLESISEQPIEHEGRVTVRIGKASLVPGEVDAAGTDLSMGSEEDEVLRRLVAAAAEDLAGVMRMAWLLRGQGSGTEVTIVASEVPPGIGQEDHETGMRSSLDNLAVFLRR